MIVTHSLSLILVGNRKETVMILSMLNAVIRLYFDSSEHENYTGVSKEYKIFSF